MTDTPRIIDPVARFVDAQHEDLVDFIFRLTGDRSRAGVMAREVCRHMKDELHSQMDEERIRARLFQLGYEISEDALQPISRKFLEDWFRYQHKDATTVAAMYRWELKLQEYGHHASRLLLLRYRYGFSLPVTAAIVYREEAEVQAELEILDELVRKEEGLDLQDLQALPRYGFLVKPEPQTTALSKIMSHLQPRQSKWARPLALAAGLAMVAGLCWLLHEFVGFTRLWHILREQF